jgi:5'(3')-deoxyribonucleotidase
MSMKRICVDMDEVIADTVAEHLLRYNRDYSGNAHQGRPARQVDLARRLDRAAIPILDDLSPRRKTSSKTSTSSPTRSASSKNSSSQYEVFIASAAMEVPTSFNAKYRWLERHFPTIPAHPHRLLRRQVHPPRRLPHRRQPTPAPPLRGSLWERDQEAQNK